jgi:hypothetical protein
MSVNDSFIISISLYYKEIAKYYYSFIKEMKGEKKFPQMVVYFCEHYPCG